MQASLLIDRLKYRKYKYLASVNQMKVLKRLNVPGYMGMLSEEARIKISEISAKSTNPASKNQIILLARFGIDGSKMTSFEASDALKACFRSIK